MSRNVYATVGLVLAVGVAVAGAGSLTLLRTPEEGMASVDPAASVQVTASVDDAGLDDASSDNSGAAMPEPFVPEVGPKLDLVRVETGGATLVAGQAGADEDVTLRLDGAEVATVRAGPDGSFVTFLDLEIAETPRVLTLETRDKAGALLASEGGVIVAPVLPQAPAAQVVPDVRTSSAPLPDEGAPDIAVDADPVETAALILPSADDAEAPEAGEPATAEAAARATARQSAAPRLFRVGPDGVEIMADGGAAPDAVEDLGIDIISYDEDGEVQLAGTGQQSSELRIYLDNEPVRTVQVGESGSWASPLPDVDAGVYTLRIDELDAAGDVSSRIETPFERTAPDLAAAARDAGVEAITVQTGFTLWAISEGYFGDGVQYVQIFEANRELIRNPDLIYPGQVIALPGEANAVAATD